LGIICAATNPSSPTARRSSPAASVASWSVRSAATCIRAGFGLRKSTAQSFHAAQRDRERGVEGVHAHHRQRAKEHADVEALGVHRA